MLSDALTGHLVATGLTNLFYISRRIIGTEKARAGIHICLATFEIIPVGRQELEQAERNGLEAIWKTTCVWPVP